MDFKELLKQAKIGNDPAIAEIMNMYRPLLHSLFLSLQLEGLSLNQFWRYNDMVSGVLAVQKTHKRIDCICA